MTLSDLLTAPGRRDVLDRLLSLYRSAGFPTASWHPGSIARHFTESSSAVLADLALLIVAIAKGGFLDFAEGPWLDLLARSLFAETRKPAVPTRGMVHLVDRSGQGPLTIAPGTYWLANRARTRRYRNIDGGTVPLNGALDLLFEAESAGVAWSVANDEITELLSPGGTGLEISNPAFANGTWITQQGVDQESDPALRQRCRDKWATIGSGSNEAAYRYWATSTSPEVTRVRVISDPGTGRVNVLVAGPSGPISTDGLNQVRGVITDKRPLTVDARADNAVSQSILIAGTLYVAAGSNPDDVLSAGKEAVDAYARGSDIGDTVYRARIIAGLVDARGARNVVLAQPNDDERLAADRVFVPNYLLTTVLLS